MPSPGTESFTMMTFNVHRDESGDAATIDAVGAPDADIVCIQEATAAWEHVLRARYGGQYRFMIFKTQENAGGLAVLSHFPLEDLGTMSISDWHPALHLRAVLPGGHLQILNVHLRAMFDGDNNPIHNYLSTGKDHLREIELFTSRFPPGAPAVVIGDFNESPKGPAVKWLEARGFRNVLPLFHPGQFTWRGRKLIAPVVLSIDHVMAGPSLMPVDANVAANGRSDHMPVVVRFELAEVSR